MGGAVPPAGAFKRRRSDCIVSFEVWVVAVAIRLRFRGFGKSVAEALGLGLSPDKTF